MRKSARNAPPLSPVSRVTITRVQQYSLPRYLRIFGYGLAARSMCNVIPSNAGFVPLIRLEACISVYRRRDMYIYIYANRAANSSLRGTSLTSISCPCAPIMKQTLPEKQPSAINQEQRGINAEWGTNGEGGENFRFARERRVDEKLDEVFFPSTASAISRGTRWKKWRANSHNKADNRAIKITFARPKKAKRQPTKKRKKSRNENFVPHPPLHGRLGARVEKFLLCGNLPAPREHAASPPFCLFFFFRRNAHTRKPRIFQNTVRAHTRVHAQRVIHSRGREREKKSVGRFSTERQRGRAEPAGWPTNQPFHIPFDGSLFPSPGT